MNVGTGLRIALVATGIVLLGVTVLSLAKRKMTESFVLTWGLISAIFVFAGVLLNPAELERYISGTGIMLIAALGFCMVFGAYFMSIRISELISRNLELAMQVTLLKQEVEELRIRIAARRDSSQKGRLADEKGARGNQYIGAGRG